MVGEGDVLVSLRSNEAVSFSDRALTPEPSPSVRQHFPRPTDFKIVWLIPSFGLTTWVSTLGRGKRIKAHSEFEQRTNFRKHLSVFYSFQCFYSFPTGGSGTRQTEGVKTELLSLPTKISLGLLPFIPRDAILPASHSIQNGFLSSLSFTSPIQSRYPANYCL